LLGTSPKETSHLCHRVLNNESQMQILLQETALSMITGDLIRSSLEHMRLEVGLPGRSDRWNWVVIDCITTDCWLKLLKYMSQHDFQLADTLPVLRTCRDSDRFLMKEFIAHGYFRKELQMLNECWKFLHVTTLAESSSADGNYLEAWAWNDTGTSDLINQYQWPRRPLLQSGYWLLWQQALQAMFLHPIATTDRKLRQSLGPWDPDILAQWKWLYLTAEDRVSHFEGCGWRVFSKIPSRVQRLCSLRFLRQEQIAPTSPADGVLATISRTRDGVRITGVTPLSPGVTYQPETTPCSIREALDLHKKLDK
jgi:hypothetical protein